MKGERVWKAAALTLAVLAVAATLNTWLSAPRHRSSVSGKWDPRSPSPAAPSSASATAWATTSASE